MVTDPQPIGERAEDDRTHRILRKFGGNAETYMASTRQQRVDQVVAELEQRGADRPTVQGDISLTKYATEKDHPGADATVVYLGDPETVRNACRSLDQVQVLDVSTQPWPGGEQEVTAEIVVLEGGSGGANPRGNADSSASFAVPPPEDEDMDEQNPHVPPGGTFALKDGIGFTDHYEVAVWPVRWWEPRPEVQAVLVLRYVPAPAAEGLEWWTGYCRLVPGGQVTPTTAHEDLLDRLNEKRIHAAGYDVNIDWHGGGWVGWSEASLPSTMAGVPVYSSVPEDWGELGNQDAGDLTTALAQAVLTARREVTR